MPGWIRPGGKCLLALLLGPPQPCIMPPCLQQAPVVTAFDNLTPVQHHDLLRVDDGGEAVGDNQAGVALRDFPQSRQDRLLRFAVQG